MLGCVFFRPRGGELTSRELHRCDVRVVAHYGFLKHIHLNLFDWDLALLSCCAFYALPSFLHLRIVADTVIAQMPVTRKDLRNMRRVLVKVGTSVVIHSDGSVALGRIGHLVEQISHILVRV